MIRNLKISKGHVNVLVQVVGNQLVGEGIAYMVGEVKLGGKIIGKLTENCLELNDEILGNQLIDDVLNVVVPTIESRFCKDTLINKQVAREQQIKAKREAFDEYLNKWKNDTKVTSIEIRNAQGIAESRKLAEKWEAEQKDKETQNGKRTTAKT